MISPAAYGPASQEDTMGTIREKMTADLDLRGFISGSVNASAEWSRGDSMESTGRLQITLPTRAGNRTGGSAPVS
jgi:hypothetical protein